MIDVKEAFSLMEKMLTERKDYTKPICCTWCKQALNQWDHSPSCPVRIVRDELKIKRKTSGHYY